MWDYYIMGIILLPAIILGIYAQSKVSSTFRAFSGMKAQSGKTASAYARELLDLSGLQHIKVIKVSGNLTDYYNHKKQVVALSSDVYDSTSVAALGIASHEVGHALQYKQNYVPIKIRNVLVPVANFSSKMLWPLVFLGIIFGFGSSSNSVVGLVFVWAGVILFGSAALLNILTLPVEFNASKRALVTLQATNTLTQTELNGAKKVLNAAALTYVAAMLVAVLNLVRFLLISDRI